MPESSDANERHCDAFLSNKQRTQCSTYITDFNLLKFCFLHVQYDAESHRDVNTAFRQR